MDITSVIGNNSWKFLDDTMRRTLWKKGVTDRWTDVRLQNLPWCKTGWVSRQVKDPLSKLQNWIWPKTGWYKTGLVSNTKIEASIRATKPKPWQSHLTSDTVEIFIQNEKAGLVPMQSRFRSRHKAGFGAAGLGTAQSWFWGRHKASFYIYFLYVYFIYILHIYIYVYI